MIPLNQLLERFKNLTNSEKTKKQLIVEILINNNIPAKIEQISFSKNTIFIKTQPIIKTELIFKKNKILDEIKKIPGLTTINMIQ